MAEGKPIELKEMKYRVGHMEVTAMLTDKQAERLGAVGVDEELPEPGVGEVDNNEAQRTATQSREAEDSGVNATASDGSTTETTSRKAATARNKRAS